MTFTPLFPPLFYAVNYDIVSPLALILDLFTMGSDKKMDDK